MADFLEKTNSQESTTSRYQQQNIPSDELSEARIDGKSKGQTIPDNNQQADSAGGSHTEQPLKPQTEAGKYGKVKIVKEDHAGNLILIDETPGNERIYILHANGSYTNINPTSWTDKVEGDMLTLVHGEFQIEVSDDRVTFIHGNEKVTIDKNRTIDIVQNNTETVGGDENIEIGGSRTKNVDGNENVGIEGSRTKNVGGSESDDIGGSWSVNTGGSVNITCGGSATVQSSGPATVQGSVGILKGSSNTLTVA